MANANTTQPAQRAKRHVAWRWTRRVLQLLVLLFVVWSILRMNVMTLAMGTSHPDAYLRLDPLVALTSTISSLRLAQWHDAIIALLHALPILLLTVFLGRAFCGMLCPLGTCIDASDRLFWRKRKKPSPVKLHWLKYAILVAVLVSAFFGSQLLHALDPISLFTRITVIFVLPLLNALHLLPKDQAPMLLGMGYQGNLLLGAIFLAVLLLGALGRRFWCRALCPLGALLGLVSRMGIFGRKVSSACRSCGSCARQCRMAAIPVGPNQGAGECILCGECAAACATGDIALGRRSPSVPTEEQPVDLSRRRVACAAAVGLLWAGTASTGAIARLGQRAAGRGTNESLLRPPSAMPEPDFLSKCMRCGACMKACPTGGLQPALSEAGLEGMLTPVLVPRLGECSAGCNSCSQVCPTQAIRPFAIEDKSHIFIGTARVDHSACLMWQDGVKGKKCLVCDEHCPYNAIYVVEGPDGKRLPYVNEALCVGCGTCEHACPVGPRAAIRVLNAAPFGDKRQNSVQEQRTWQERMAPIYPKGE